MTCIVGGARRVKRVVLTGSESVGKSTLANRLASHYAVPGSIEFVREYVRTLGRSIDTADHAAIAAGQIAGEEAALEAAARSGRRLVVHDTDLVSTVVYAHHYTGECDPTIEQLAQDRLADCYLLLDIDVPWVLDDVRDQLSRRAEVHAVFEQTLTRFQAPYHVVRGAWDQRFLQAVQVIDRLLSS